MTDTDVHEDGAPPPTVDPTRPPLARNTNDKVIAGVAGGVARHFGWDPLLVRIGFVMACFLGGAGLLAYVAGWVMLPRDSAAEAPDYRSPSDLQHRGLAFWVGLGLMALAALALVGDTIAFAPGLIVAAALVALGVAIWRTGERAADQPAAPLRPGASLPGSSETVAPAGVTAQALAVTDTQAFAPPVPPATQATPTPGPEHGPRRPPSYLGRITVALALIATSVTVALERADVLDLSVTQVLGVPLIVLAGGLLIGTWWGRGRWLILPALAISLSLPIVAIASELDVDLASGIGERHVTIHGVSDEGVHRLGIGSLTIDLATALADESGARDLEIIATVGLGELVILLPDDPDVGYEIVALARNGEIRDADGDSFQGRRVTRTVRRDAVGGAGTIRVEATVGAGVIDVVR